MKSFGVRLAAGTITILFGAYAAVLAQKDKQDNSGSWTAEAPNTGEPAVPIGDIGGDSWLSQPDTGLKDAGLSEVSQTPNSVRLVQHTEPIPESTGNDSPSTGGPAFDASMLPESLNSDNAPEAPATEVAQLTLPEQGGDNSSGAEPTAGPGLTFSLPADPNPSSTESQPSSVLPEAELGVPPMEVFTVDQGEEAASLESALDNAAQREQPPAADPSAVGYPSNILRGAEPGMNTMRGEYADAPAANPTAGAESQLPSDGPESFGGPESAFSSPASDTGGPASGFGQPPQGFAQPSAQELGQEEPGFGGSPQPFAQAAAIPDAARSGLGTPQFGDAAQPSAAAPLNNGPSIGSAPSPRDAAPYGASAALGAAPAVGAAAAIGAASQPGDSQPRIAGLPSDASELNGQPARFNQPASAVAMDPNATIDSPGDRRLDGAQTPSIIIQKRAPNEVKVGKPASFVVHVQNVGTVEALAVKVHDRVPLGMRLIDASPAPILQGNMLLWELGSMPAGDERTLTMQLVPEQEGELGSVARVSFEAAASVRTISTRPELKIVQTAPETVLIGQQLEIELEISNPGSGEATGVMLQEDVPEGLEHPKGRQLDNGLGTLAPGEVQNQVLRLRAVAPGIVQNTIRLAGDDGLVDEHTVTVQVVAPELKALLTGPSRGFLQRPATYQLDIANVGTADATNIELSVQLDRGFTFVSTDFEGQYDRSRHAVYWSLAQLPAGGAGKVPLTLMPVQEGEQAIVIDARADLGIAAKSERKMTVEGFAELSFAISNPGGPIAVGGETEYEIRITNAGSKPDSNVRVQLQLPAELELINADSEAGTDGRGLVAFQPHAQLAPGAEQAYRVRLRGLAPGTHIVKAVVVSDQAAVPITKEESTRVYADQ